MVCPLQQLMWIYSVSLCSDQCTTLPNRGKAWHDQRKVRGDPSPSCHLYDIEVLWNKSYEMLPLDPVKELVGVTRAKFHHPSMAFRICQVKRKQPTKTKRLGPRSLEKKALILTKNQSWVNGNLTTKIASLYLEKKNLKAYKCLQMSLATLSVCWSPLSTFISWIRSLWSEAKDTVSGSSKMLIA